MMTPMANQGALVNIGKILQEVELKRQEDREQQERTLQVYMKQMQQQIQQQLQPFQIRKESILGTNHHKRRKLQRFLIFMVDVIPKSTLIGKLKWNKFSMKII